MFGWGYKNVAIKFRLLFGRNGLFFGNKDKSSIKGWGLLGNQMAGRNYFGSKKQNFTVQKEQKQVKQGRMDWQEEDYLWKVNTVLNIVGMGAGFYFPTEALTLVLTSNSIFQVYESSKSIKTFKEIIQKMAKRNSSDSANLKIELKQVLRKIVISSGLLLTAAISLGLKATYPQIGDYYLLGLNFWILFNIKFTNLSHGYYFVLISLAAFQYLYFQKVFESNQPQIPLQRP